MTDPSQELKFSSYIQNAKLMLRLNLSATYETTNCRCHFATYNRVSPCSFLSWCVRVLYLPRTVPSFSCCCWTVSHHSRNISAVGEWQDFFLVERGRRAGKRTSAQQPSCIIEIRRYSVRLSNPNSRDSGRFHLAKQVCISFSTFMYR